MDTMIVVWAVLIVIFLVVEGATPGLVSIWFAVGALASLLSAFLKAPLWLQIILFIVVSCTALYFTRPLAKKFVNKKITPTNADMVIGATALVTQRIDNIAGTGAVSVGGKIWTARSATGEAVEEGALTVVKSIEGVKLIVKMQTEKQLAKM